MGVIMKIKLNKESIIALTILTEDDQDKFVRLKVLSFGCGKPALGLESDEKKLDDLVEYIDGITFVVDSSSKIYFEDIEILYDPETYVGDGFYIRRL